MKNTAVRYTEIAAHAGDNDAGFRAFRLNAQPGDCFQGIFGPHPANRALYGSPMTPEMMAPLAALMDGVDLAVLQSAYQRFWIFSEHSLAIAIGVANG